MHRGVIGGPQGLIKEQTLLVEVGQWERLLAHVLPASELEFAAR